MIDLALYRQRQLDEKEVDKKLMWEGIQSASNFQGTGGDWRYIALVLQEEFEELDNINDQLNDEIFDLEQEIEKRQENLDDLSIEADGFY